MAIEKGTLIHWWHYYGKMIYTFAELEEFEKLIDEHGVEKILDVAVASYICSDGSPSILLTSMRNGKVGDLFTALPKVEEMKADEREAYEKVKEQFIQIISKTE